MVVDGESEQLNAVVCSPPPFFSSWCGSMNLQNGFKDGMTASEEVQEADAVCMCFDVFVTCGITCWPVMGETSAWFTCRVGGYNRL